MCVCVCYISSQIGLSSVLRWLWLLLWKRPGGSVRIHLAQPFSLKVHSRKSISWKTCSSFTAVVSNLCGLWPLTMKQCLLTLLTYLLVLTNHSSQVKALVRCFHIVSFWDLKRCKCPVFHKKKDKRKVMTTVSGWNFQVFFNITHGCVWLWSKVCFVAHLTTSNSDFTVYWITVLHLYSCSEKKWRSAKTRFSWSVK